MGNSEFGIGIHAEGKVAIVAIRTADTTAGDPNQPWLHFKIDCGQPYLAEAFTQRAQEALYNAVKDAHRKGYEQGWKDKAAKRRKKKSFFCHFTRRDTVAY